MKTDQNEIGKSRTSAKWLVFCSIMLFGTLSVVLLLELTKSGTIAVAAAAMTVIFATIFITLPEKKNITDETSESSTSDSESKKGLTDTTDAKVQTKIRPTEEIKNDSVASNNNLPKKTSDYAKPGLVFAEKFEIIEELGTGGMSTVFKARHAIIEIDVALKVLKDRDAARGDRLKRFVREAKVMGGLKHPNIVGIRDFGLAPSGQAFLVMDYVEGESLQEMLSLCKTLSIRETKEIALQLCDALAYAHSQGVVHRDLKPSNILVAPGPNDSLKVTIVDFGLAKLDETSPMDSITQTGDCLGSPLYMSPEQCEGSEMTARSDIYSLGCVLFECLTGAPPIVRNTILSTLNAQMSESPSEFPEDIDISNSMKLLIYKCLEKDQSNRPESIETFKNELIDCFNRHKPAEKEPPSSDSTCSSCGKPIRQLSRGSVTAWIFRNAACNCKIHSVVSGEVEKQNSDTRLDETKGPEGTADSLGTSSASPDANPQFPGYEIEKTLGSGAMGTVYKVRELTSGSFRAAKVLDLQHLNDTEMLGRFEQEGKILESLEHPHLVSVSSSGRTTDGRPFILMSFVEGKPLDQHLKENGALPQSAAARIFKQMCEALTHMHQKNLIHRDIKPENIILTNIESGAENAVLVDFSIAKATGKGEDPALSQTGDIFGSPAYMSPEQCMGEEVGPQSDIYSLGCVIYETIAARPPFQHNNPVKMMMQHINKQPLPPDERTTEKIDPALSKAILRCLAKEKSERYSTAAEIVQDIESLT